ncbi:hypothetical protein ACGH2B_11940 [Streptomyces sp. BBFR2]|uniref:hypothetical protein n=1 Tax=Streptomyces sp. BBFR2 TaxID=3372854 RepID=UPI0037DA02F2
MPGDSSPQVPEREPVAGPAPGPGEDEAEPAAGGSASGDVGDPDDWDDPLTAMDTLAERLSHGGAGRPLIYAPYANLNAGRVDGGQHAHNRSDGQAGGERPVESHEGPVSVAEIAKATSGFAEPGWFPDALEELNSGLLFLTGKTGSGRRTSALNLLVEHSGSADLRAVDREVNLAVWRPREGERARGYLVDGIVGHEPLGPGTIANLKERLTAAGARMVIILPDEPELIRVLLRDLPDIAVECVPPPPREVFDARFEVAVPDPAERARLRAALEPGLLDELLDASDARLVPAEVAELVDEVAEPGDGAVGADLRSRLSYLAHDKAPELVEEVRDDPDALAFLLALCVFEGLDHRIVWEQAERLLTLANGRLDAVVSDTTAPPATGGAPQQRRPNPDFVFRRSLDDLMKKTSAQTSPKEIRNGSGFSYAVEPVRFTRHRQGEAVLSHVWRQYSRLSGLLTEWLDGVGNEQELHRPVGRALGLAAGWGGGRRALRHIKELADSPSATSRTLAAYALDMAAQDPVLDGEIKHRLRDWSGRKSWQLCSTVARTCGTGYGAARPEFALRTLRRLSRRKDLPAESGIDGDIRRAVLNLFASGGQEQVFAELLRWSEQDSGDFALRIFLVLLRSGREWFGEQLLEGGGTATEIVTLIRRTLDDRSLFDTAHEVFLGWCRAAPLDDTPEPSRALFTALAQDLSTPGVFRLFFSIEKFPEPLPVHPLVTQALDSWRHGGPLPGPVTTTQGSAV